MERDLRVSNVYRRVAMAFVFTLVAVAILLVLSADETEATSICAPMPPEVQAGAPVDIFTDVDFPGDDVILEYYNDTNRDGIENDGSPWVLIDIVTDGFPPDLDPGPGTILYPWFTPAALADTQIIVRSFDPFGIMPFSYGILLLDNTPPETSLAASGTVWWESSPSDLIVYGPDHSLTISATDINGTGVASTEYQVDGSGWIPYAGAFTLSGTGWHTVDYRSTDNLAQVEPTKTTRVYVANTYMTGTQSTGTYNDQYLFACNVTVTGTVTLQNTTIILNSTVGNTQYFDVDGPSGHLVLTDWDSDPGTIYDEAMISNIDASHYYYMRVNQGASLTVDYSTIEYCGYVDPVGPEPTTFADLGVWINNGTATLTGPRFHSPQGVGVIFEGDSGSYMLDGEGITNYYGLFDSYIGFGVVHADNVQILDTQIQNNTMLGGYVNASTPLIRGNNFTQNGIFILTPDGFGGGLFINGSSFDLPDNTFYMNDGVGLVFSGDMTVHDSTFTENCQALGNASAEVIIFAEEDLSTPMLVEFYGNTVSNTLGRDGLRAQGAVGLHAHNNTFNTPGNLSIGGGFHTESTSAVNLPYFYVRDNNITGDTAIHFGCVKSNESNASAVTIGPVEIINNALDTTSTAINVDITMLGTDGLIVGDLTITNNDLTGYGGIYRPVLMIYAPVPGSDCTIGQTLISHNDFTNTDEGIGIMANMIMNTDGGSISWGNTIIASNTGTITVGSGFNSGGDMITNITDTTINIGQWSMYWNNLTTGSAGAWVDAWRAMDLHGTASITIGDYQITDNIFDVSAMGVGMHFMTVGQMMWDYSSVDVGDVVIDQNTIDSGTEGIMIMGNTNFFDMHNYSQGTFGNIEITENQVVSTGGQGIHFLPTSWGSQMYDLSTFTMGDLLFEDNNISADTDGIWLMQMNIGFGLYNSTVVRIGDTDIINNTINAGQGTVSGHGIFAQAMMFGFDTHGKSYVEVGNYSILENNIAGYYGIYAGLVTCGMSMFDDSAAAFNDLDIIHNEVDAVETSLMVTYASLGVGLSDNTVVTIGNTSILYNNFTSQIMEGFNLAQASVGVGMADNAYVSMGWTDISYNNFSANTDGVYIDRAEMGTSMSGSTQAHFGYLHLTNNNISSTNINGIHFYRFYHIGYQLQGSALVTSGDILVNDNTIDALVYGIYLFEWYNNAFDLNNFASVTLGHIEFNRNDINTTVTGIYISLWTGWGSQLSISSAGACHVSMGHVQFNHNGINSTAGDGFFAPTFDTMGYDMYGDSTFTMGNIEMIGNYVNASGTYGINFGTIIQHGSNMNNNAQATFGDILFNQNTIINSGSYGFYIGDLGYKGYQMNGDSQVSFGGFEFNHNFINSSGAGVQLYSTYWGSSMWHNSQATFGNFLVEDNDIIALGGTGIYLDNRQTGTDNNDNSIVSYGLYSVSRNTINASGNGLYYNIEDFGRNLHSYANVTFGGFQFNDNIIDSLNTGIGQIFRQMGMDLHSYASVTIPFYHINGNIVNSTSYGFYFSEFYYLGANLYQYSLFHWGGFQLNHNTVNSSTDGIYLANFNMCGVGLWENSEVAIGDIEISDNDIIAQGGYGIYGRPHSFGESMYDYSTFTMGDWLLNNNTIQSTGAGIYLDAYEFAYTMYFGSEATIGSCEINHNTINSTGGVGIESRWWNQFGHWLYESSKAEIGDATIMHNDIIANSDGLYLDPQQVGATVYDNSIVTFGDYRVLHNTIDSTGQGVYFYTNGMADTVMPFFVSPANGSVTIGEIHIGQNNITATSIGVSFNYELVARSILGECSATLGDVWIEGNTIEATDGIYAMRNLLGNGIHDDAIVMMGAFYIANNDINASLGFSYGIDLHQQSSVLLYDDSRFYCDEILIYGNTIRNADNALQISYDFNGETFGNSYGEIPGTVVYDNTINSSSWGLVISISGSPIAQAPGSTQVWGDIEVYDCDFTGDLGALLQSDSGSLQPHVWIRDCTFTDPDGGLGGTGFQGMNSYVPALIERTTFTDFEDAIYAEDALLQFGSCTLAGVTGWDIDMDASANVFMVDSPFDTSNVQFVDVLSTLDVGWYLTVNVETQTGERIPGANVVATSNGTLFIENGVTDPNGQTTLMLREGRYDQANPPTGAPIVNYNPHNLSATAAGLTGYADPEVTVDMSKSVTVVIFDNIPPAIGGDASDLAGTTGDPFTFRTTATDNIGMDFIRIHYRFGSGAWNTANMLVPGAPWERTFDLPTNFTGTMEFYFVAHDLAGNTDTSATFSGPITDNDAPTGAVDNSTALGTTGESFEFNVTGIDNVGVTYAAVTYWFGTGSPTTQVMSGTTSFSYSITIPPNSANDLHYRFLVRDGASLTYTTGDVIRIVTDNDDPLMIADESDTSAATGDPFTFNVNASDNIGITLAQVEYWFGSGSHSTASLAGSGPYSLDITVPANSVDDLHYRFLLEDAAGNILTGSQQTIVVVDNDDPTGFADHTLGFAIEGETLEFNVVATDNIGITLATVEYWFGNGSHTTMNLTGTGPYVLEIRITEDETLHYSLEFTDATSNVFSVLNNELPVVFVAVPTTAGTGEDVTIIVDSTDTGLDMEVHIVYWYGTGAATNVTLDDGWPTEATITLPADSLTPLSYHLEIFDGSDWSSGATINITAEDVVGPDNIVDASDTVATPGEEFVFSASALDNINVTTIQVEYWFGTGDPVILNLTGSPAEATITIPDGNEDDLHYVFIATDSAGNTHTTEERTLSPAILAAEADKELEEAKAMGLMDYFPWLLVIILAIILALLIVGRRKDKEMPPPAPLTGEEAATAAMPPLVTGGEETPWTESSYPPAMPVEEAPEPPMAESAMGEEPSIEETPESPPEEPEEVPSEDIPEPPEEKPAKGESIVDEIMSEVEDEEY